MRQLKESWPIIVGVGALVVLTLFGGFIGGLLPGGEPERLTVSDLAGNSPRTSAAGPKFGWETAAPTVPPINDPFWDELLEASGAELATEPNPEPVTVPMEDIDRLDGYCRNTFGAWARTVLHLKPVDGGTAYRTIIYRVTGGGTAQDTTQPPPILLPQDLQPGDPLVWKTDLEFYGGRAVVYDSTTDKLIKIDLDVQAGYFIPEAGQAVQTLTLCAY
jgi:hypothetical protein